MNQKQFGTILNKQQLVFKDAGYDKQGDLSFVNSDNIKLEVILNKWQWTDSEGWSFVARAFDLGKQDEYGNIHPDEYIDIKPIYLIDNGLLSEKSLKALYDSWGWIEYDPEHDTDLWFWYRFKSDSELEQILALTLKPITKATHKLSGRK